MTRLIPILSVYRTLGAPPIVLFGDPASGSNDYRVAVLGAPATLDLTAASPAAPSPQPPSCTRPTSTKRPTSRSTIGRSPATTC